MAKRFAVFGLATAVLLGPGIPTLASTADTAPVALKTHAIVLAQLSPAEYAACQAEEARLYQQLGQCPTDACRQQLQAAINAHNARCR
jgi:hypothetical protein